ADRAGARYDRAAQHAADAVRAREDAGSRARHRARRGRLRHARGGSRQGARLRARQADVLAGAERFSGTSADADADPEVGLLKSRTEPGPPGSKPATAYRDAGVDIDAGDETVRRIRSLARATFTRDVLSDIGSFGGLFRLDRDRCREPVLV